MRVSKKVNFRLRLCLCMSSIGTLSPRKYLFRLWVGLRLVFGNGFFKTLVKPTVCCKPYVSVQAISDECTSEG